MKSIVDILVRPYFEDPASEFDSNTFYLGYQLVEEPINVRINSLIYQFIVGHIEYRRKDSLICSSSSEYLVKYCECSESEPDSQVFGPFITELHFFRTLLPALDRVRPISHTFVKFCNSNISAPATSNKTAMLFKWPEGARLSEKIPVRSLGSERCSSMLKSIARLHAQSLQLCRNDPDGVFQKSRLLPIHFRRCSTLTRSCPCCANVTKNCCLLVNFQTKMVSSVLLKRCTGPFKVRRLQSLAGCCATGISAKRMFYSRRPRVALTRSFTIASRWDLRPLAWILRYRYSWSWLLI